MRPIFITCFQTVVSIQLILFVSPVVWGQAEATSKAVSQPTKVDDYTSKAEKWISELELKEDSQKERVRGVIAEHLKAIDLWYREHPATLVPEGINPVTGKKLSELDRKMIVDSAIPSSVHENLMSGLRANLEAVQVEQILDQYTVGKVDFTMKGYRAIVPDLTPDEEKTILGFLKEAREMAVDYKSMKEISAIFEIYKTKSEQHLIANGRNWRALYKAYVDSVQAAKKKGSK